MYCNNCDKGLIVSSDKGLVYTGPNIDTLDIKSGDSYASVLPKMLNEIMKPKEVNERSYTSSDIKNEGNLYDLNRNSSLCSAEIVNKNFVYSVESNTSGYSFNYNLSTFTSALPSGMTISYIDIRAFGTSQMGSTLVASAKDPSGGFFITPDRMPVTVEFDIMVSSKCGTIQLNRSVGTFEKGNFNTSLNITDSNKLDTKGFSQTQTNELLAAEVSKLRADIENLKSVNTFDTDNIKYSGDKTTSSVVNTLTAKVDETIEKVKKLEEIYDGATITAIPKG